MFEDTITTPKSPEIFCEVLTHGIAIGFVLRARPARGGAEAGRDTKVTSAASEVGRRPNQAKHFPGASH
jgi:hypothetical protein